MAKDATSTTRLVKTLIPDAALAAMLLVFCFVRPAIAGTVSFSNPVNYTVGEVPDAIAVGDFNGDGKPDLAVTNLVSNDVSVLLGNGDGTFKPAINYGCGSGPGSIAKGDFNGDGRLDLATADFNGGTVSVLLGNGDGTFQPARIISVAGSPTTVAIGDFNGDSRIDLAVGQSGSNGPQVTLLLGDGRGGFQRSATYSVSGHPSSLIVADLNGDRKQDLAVAAGNQVGVLLGNGDGTFQQTRYLPPATGSIANSVAIGDFNLDGKMDLVVLSHDPCFALLCALDAELFFGNGDGTFQGPSKVAELKAYSGGGFAISDFNRDGNLDVAFESRGIQGGSVTVVPGNGDGSFKTPVSLPLGFNPVPPVAADLN